MIAIITGLLLLAGPFVALGIWLWLRSRRDPVQLAEPLDLGRVLADTFGVFRVENIVVPALALILIGLPSLVWQMAFQPSIQAQMQASSTTPAKPFAALASFFSPVTLAVTIADFLILAAFYVMATLFLVRRFEGRPVATSEALKAMPLLVVPALVVALLAYAGIMLGMIAFVVPGFVLATSWCVVIPVLVSERTGLWRSFGRSRALALGSRGRVLLLGIIMLLISFLLSVPSGFAAGLFGGRPTLQPGVAGLAVRTIVAVISGSIHAAFFSALYVELRRIREGIAMPELEAVFA
jgi:hypothetical protein